MVPDQFERRATAHFIAFKQRKKVLIGGKSVLVDVGNLTFELYLVFKSLRVTFLRPLVVP